MQHMRYTVLLALILGGCQKPGLAPGAPEEQPGVLKQSQDSAKGPDITVEGARAFIREAEAELLKLWQQTERAHWVKATYITVDTQHIASAAHERLMAKTAEFAAMATRFAKLDLPEDVARKFRLLRLSLSLPSPPDEADRAELARLVTRMESHYSTGQVCHACSDAACPKQTDSPGKKGPCLNLGQISEVFAKSRNEPLLRAFWVGWRRHAAPLKKDFMRYVELGNQGARALGFADLGALWASRYDMTPEAFEKEIDRLYTQIKPLYKKLHCFVRGKLAQRYGAKVVPAGQPIPAHLLGNMWAQDWSHLSDLLLPRGSTPIDLEAALKRKRIDGRPVDEQQMVRFGEAFFVSLGMAPLPETFWQRSLFKRPRDRDVVCHASAWDVDWDADLRIKMCIRINGEDFSVIHHELGHNYYQYYYRKLDPLFRDSANSGFHEGLGDTIALSVTPSYLKQLGLLTREPKDAIGPLLRRALEKVAFLPFGLLIDKWRWEIFSGKTSVDRANDRYWELRRQYQGVRAPKVDFEAPFDPAAKYHVVANVPYVRYFVAHILQFQFHRALCRIAGHRGPLHTCSIYDNKAAGKRLIAMMELGQSRPWPEALKALTGSEKMDAGALLEYFQPLSDWLDTQTQGKTCGF